MYSHLHVHTGYSFLDGFCDIKKLVARVKELGQEAVAITDHGNVHGIIEFYKECQKQDVHPIIGCEVYFAIDRTIQKKPTEEIKRTAVDLGLEPKRFEELIKIAQAKPENILEVLTNELEVLTNEFEEEKIHEVYKFIDTLGLNNYHLVLLAKDNEGLKNLYHIISDANINGFYYKPRTDLSVLKEHGRGLIGLSACLAGRIPYLLLTGLYDQAKDLAATMAEYLDEFYLELQPNSIPEQALANARLVRLARSTGLPLVATCDSHYILKEDHEVQDILLCIQTNKKVADDDRLKFLNDFWIKSETEVRDGLSYLDEDAVEEAIINTNIISGKCDVVFEFGHTKFPVYQLPSGETPEARLRKMCKRKLLSYALRKNIDFQKYQDQLNYELDVICDAGFAPYFLATEDFTTWARKNNIMVGPGRGSAAGSLVTYLLGITNLDPLEYNLLFERFLNPERVEPPDTDIDYDYEYRDKVIEYAAERYGRDKLAHICTFGTIGIKSAVKDVGRALEIPYTILDKITKLVPEHAASVEEALELSPLLDQYKEEYPDLFRLAAAVQNMPRHVSTHASGIVIAPGPMEEYVPVFVDKSGQHVTQFEMNNITELGLIKFDFLGLRTLTIIRRTLDLIPEKINLNTIPLDDQNVFSLYRDGQTDGIFQMEGEAFKRMLVKMRPTSFEDLVAAAALFRPGPLGSGMVDDYIERKHGRKVVEYFHSDLEPILKATYGVIVYQEQVMQIARVMAGYTLGQADLLRKAVGKKKPELIQEHRQYFIYGSKEMGIPGAVNRGYSEELAKHIYDLIEYFAGYGFNRSHSACYAYISYQTAWLKYYYPVEFMTAILSMEAKSGDKDGIKHYIETARNMDIDILPPDINASGSDFTCEHNAIRMGLLSIIGVGGKAVDTIIQEKSFTGFDDFIQRVRPNKTVVVNLVKAGAFDCFESNRNILLNYYYDTYRPKDKNRPLISDSFPLKQKREYEIEVFGFPVTTLTKWEQAGDGEKVVCSGKIADIREYKDKKQRDMAFLKLATTEAVRDIVMFANEYETYRHLLFIGNQVVISGKKDHGKVLCNNLKKA